MAPLHKAPTCSPADPPGLLAALPLVLSACGGGGSDDDDGGSARYRLSGTVAGLEAGKTLVLQNGGGDDLSVGANGGFAFAATVAAGTAYAVTIKTQPAGQQCAVANGSGTATADVANVAISCATRWPAACPHWSATGSSASARAWVRPVRHARWCG